MDELDRLRSLRDVLTDRINSGRASDHALAALAGQLRDTLARIDACEKAAPSEKGTALDELRAKRAARAAKGSPAAKGAKSGRRG